MFESRRFELSRLHGFYPEKEYQESSLERALITAVGRVPLVVKGRQSVLRRLARRVDQAGAALPDLSDAELAASGARVAQQLRQWGLREELIIASFAHVREVCARRTGKRHYPAQLMGGFVLLYGMVAEMEPGEGKTLTATLPACSAALAGIPVHVITVNDYLAQRDAALTAPIYSFFRLSVGCVIAGMDPAARRRAYACDITYCTNKEVVFDYLKDRIAMGRRPGRIQLAVRRFCGAPGAGGLLLRGLPFAIVDEADSVLIDEARTPLIISGAGSQASEEAEIYHQAIATVRTFTEGKEFSVDYRTRSVELAPEGKEALASVAAERGGFWLGQRRREELVTQALSAQHLFQLDRDYLIKDNKIKIVDEYTGRVMGDRSWEQGLHQLIEAKEGCPLSPRNETVAKISYQRFFRRYSHLSGMTGTAREVTAELWSVYRLNVVRIATNSPLIRKGYPFRYYRSAQEKWGALVSRVQEVHGSGRPVLIGTRSVAVSEEVSRALEQARLEHVVLNARQDEAEAEIISRAGLARRITVATNMAGRGTDILLGDGVRELGGLHVIATELNDARRIDRQLFGRCGRQGDPGSYEALISFEDEIFLRRKKSLLRQVAIGWGGKGLIGKALGRLYSELEQRWIQAEHGHIRNQLLKLDEETEKTISFSGAGE